MHCRISDYHRVEHMPIHAMDSPSPRTSIPFASVSSARLFTRFHRRLRFCRFVLPEVLHAHQNNRQSPDVTAQTLRHNQPTKTITA